MGAPNIDTALADNQAAIEAVNAATAQAFSTLSNNVAAGVAYINAHTKGIIQQLESQSPYYSKFSEDFDLTALDSIVDSAIKTCVDAIKLQAGDESPDLAAQTAQDIGTLVKGALALAATSSSTEQSLQVTFSYIVAGSNNFAVYYANNSTVVDAQSVWGGKSITVIATTYVVALCNPNPEITYAKMLQNDLNTLASMNEKYNAAMENCTSEAQFDALDFYQKMILNLTARIQGLLNQEKKKALLARL